jgi:hypothetical protein
MKLGAAPNPLLAAASLTSAGGPPLLGGGMLSASRGALSYLREEKEGVSG